MNMRVTVNAFYEFLKSHYASWRHIFCKEKFKKTKMSHVRRKQIENCKRSCYTVLKETSFQPGYKKFRVIYILTPLLQYTMLQRSVAVFIPDWAVVFITAL